jgi:hypothetical protein
MDEQQQSKPQKEKEETEAKNKLIDFRLMRPKLLPVQLRLFSEHGFPAV